MTVQKVQAATLAGSLKSTQEIDIHNLVFPEFHRTRHIEGSKARSFNQDKCCYNIIISRDILSKAGFIINFANHIMEWDEVCIAMRPFPMIQADDLSIAEYLLQDSL